MKRLASALKKNADKVRIELSALSLAYRDARTPWYAKLSATLVIAYALSPVETLGSVPRIPSWLDVHS